MPRKNILPQEFVNWAKPLVQGLHEARKEGTKRAYMEKVLDEFDTLPFADPSYSAYKKPDGTSKIDTKEGQTEADVLRIRAGEWFRNNSRTTATLIRPGGKAKRPPKTRGSKATELYFASLEEDEKNRLLDDITNRLGAQFDSAKDREKNRLAMRDTVLREALSLLDEDDQKSWKVKAGEVQQENRDVLASAPYLLANQQAFVNELHEFIEKRVPQLGTCGVWVHGVYMNEAKETPTGFVVGMQSCGKDGWTDDSTYQEKVLPAWRKFGSRWCTREYSQKQALSQRRKGTVPADTGTQSESSSHVEGASAGNAGPDGTSIRGAPEKTTAQGPESAAVEPHAKRGGCSESQESDVEDDVDDGPVSPRKKRVTTRRVVESASRVTPPRSSLDDDDDDGDQGHHSRTLSPVDDLDIAWAATPPILPADPGSNVRDVPAEPRAARKQLAVPSGGRSLKHLQGEEDTADDIEDASASAKSPRGMSAGPRKAAKRKAAELMSSTDDDADGAGHMNGTSGGTVDAPTKTKKRKVAKNDDGTSAGPALGRQMPFSRELKALGAAKTGARGSLGSATGRQTRRSSAGSGIRAGLRSARKPSAR
ncbi:hypothetical protein AURDEDRAFT_130134 [Auricularia subglabra TFB-10046 SS5]|uniref:Uncharacterized protein n=1 Tax=Auricularia subglabra (strain TFB-10046 / SS5) TaxID=717982 RepID=J0CYC6_AURST|nr:hypothetical protein AURDEDRAFT_130134 [Auricularia subglabra TFB-10046 SS5]